MTTCEPSPQLDLLPMESELMSSVVASPARTLARAGHAEDSTAASPASGLKCCDWFASYDPITWLWRTSQTCFIEGLTEFSETWPRAGMTLNGDAYQLRQLGFPKRATECGLLPTLVRSDSKQVTNGSRPDRSISSGQTMTDWVRLRLSLKRVPVGLAEQMMGFRPGWTELPPSGTPSSHKSRKPSAAQSSQASERNLEAAVQNVAEA
jgi:hypothetical protein